MTVLSSMQASQMNAFYAQQYRGMGMMQPVSMMAEQAMSGAMSRGAAVGMPVLGGMAGMMGLDPMSMGMRAASFGWNQMGMGVMGAGAMGLGAAGLAGIGAQGMQFAASQMFQGAQNQLSFNNAMRQNFNFMRGDGSQGFNRSDLSQISGVLQSMTHSYGPGGETTSFGELSRLAANMGKMGLTPGVRDAQEFSRKFKEMVSTLKTVATELGTSLESAQELLSSARGSGIFRTVDQLKFSGMMRNTGLAGGLSTSEMTAMANIGSRISRSVGGLGRQGAMGGIRALGQVGTATQIGALSEEDIYNATGLTGEEGRQAMAAEMMQNTGNFLRTGKGRYFLASVAGKNGSLNQSAVDEYLMGGGMGTGRTAQLAHENLNGIGRANFIRNEGRLRGAVMEQFGGLAPAIALMGWAQQRGININDMDDRSMLFAQRQLGMGRDELDATVKMAQNLPEIMSEQRKAARLDEYAQGRAQYMKGRDIRTRLDHIREKVQSTLQKAGGDLFQSGSEFLEESINKMLGSYDTWASKNAADIAEAAKQGGSGNAAKFSATFGSQKGLFGMSDAEVSRMGGYLGGQQADPGKQAEAVRAGKMITAANYGGADRATLDYAKSNASDLLGAYSGGIASKRGDDRIAAVSNYLQDKAKKGDAGAQKILTQMQTNPEAAAGIVGAMEKQIGLGSEAQLGSTYDKGDIYGGTGGFTTEAEQKRAFGRLLLGGSDYSDLSQSTGKSVLYSVGASFIEGAAQFVWAGKALFGSGGTDAAEVAATGFERGGYNSLARMLAGKRGTLATSVAAAFDDDHTKQLMRNLATGRDADAARREMATLSAKKERSPLEEGQLTLLKSTEYGAQYAALKQRGDTAGIQALINRASNDPVVQNMMPAGQGVTEETLDGMKNGAAGMFGAQRKIDVDKTADQWVKMATKSRDTMAKLGIIEMKDVLDASTGRSHKEFVLSSKTRASLSSSGAQAADMAAALLNKQTDLAGITDPAARGQAMEDINRDNVKLNERIAAMSIEEKQKFARAMQGTEFGDAALDAIGAEKRLQGITRATGKNVGAAAARFLGLNLGKDREKLFEGKSNEDIAKSLTASLGGDADISKAGFGKDLKEALDAMKSGKPEAGMMLKRALSGADPEIQKKIKEQAEGENDPLQKAVADNTKSLVDETKNVNKNLLSIQSSLDSNKSNSNPDKDS